jgi:hypothetical protein
MSSTDNGFYEDQRVRHGETRPNVSKQPDDKVIDLQSKLADCLVGEFHYLYKQLNQLSPIARSIWYDKTKRFQKKLHSLGYRSPSEIRAIERDAVERVIKELGKYEHSWNNLTWVTIPHEDFKALKSELLGEKE